MFFHFWQKFKMAAILGPPFFLQFFENCQEYIAWVENFDEIALSRMVWEIDIFKFFAM